VGLETGPLSLVSTIQELLGRKSGGFGLEIREYDRRDPSCSPRSIDYPQKLALTPAASGGHSLGTVRSRTQATEVVSCNPSSSIVPLGSTELLTEMCRLCSKCEILDVSQLCRPTAVYYRESFNIFRF
jgi:hypothetical protein